MVDKNSPLHHTGKKASAAVEPVNFSSEDAWQVAEWRARKLQAIQVLITAINSEIELNKILDLTCEAAHEVFDVDHSGLVLFEPGLVSGRVEAEYPDLGTRGLAIPVQGVPAEEQLITSREPLVYSDVHEGPALGPIQEIFHDFDIRSILIVPLVAKGRVLGSFSLDTIGHPHAFTSEEVELCQLFAAQVSVAIENARLFAETERRIRHLEILRQTTLALTSQLDRDSLLTTIIQQAVALLGAKSGGIYEYRPERGDLIIVADHGRQEKVLGNRLKIGEGMAGWLVQKGKSFLIEDNYNGSPYMARTYDGRRPFGAVIEVPLKWQGKVIGVLYVDDEVGRRFTSEDAKLLQLFADQAAIAMINADLAAKDATKLRRLEQLSQASNEIMGRLGDMGLDEVLNLIARYATEILEAEGCGISLVKRPGYLSFAANHGYQEGYIEKGREFTIQSGPKSGLTGHIAYEGKVFRAQGQELRNHPAVKGEEPPPIASGECYSLVAIPLYERRGSEKALIGLLRVENKKDRQGQADPALGFDQEDEWILGLFADAAVAAIAGAELVTELGQQKDHLALLLRASNVVTQARNLTDGLQSLAEMVVTLLDVSFCHIFLLAERSNLLLPKAAYIAARSRQELEWQHNSDDSIHMGEWPLLTELLMDGGPVLLGIDNSHEQSGILFQEWLRCLGIDENIQSLFLIPLRTRDRGVGLFCLGDLRPWTQLSLSKDKVELATAIADQTAVLIDQIYLLELTERHRQLLVTLDEASRSIRAESETEKLLQEIVRLAAELVGFSTGGLYINHPHLNKLELNVTYALPVRLIGSQLSHEDNIIGNVARTSRPQVAQQYTPWSETDGGISFQTFVALPLKQAGDVEAVLFIGDSKGQRLFLTSDLEILERFAVQASLALRASRLMNQEQRMFRQLTILHKISNYIQAAGELEKILHVVLTGVTAGYSLGFNRAALLLVDGTGQHLVGRMAIGHLIEQAARSDWQRDREQGLYDLGGYLDYLGKGALPPTPLDEQIRGMRFLVRAEAADVFSRAIHEGSYIRVTEDELSALPDSFIAAFEPALPFIIVPLMTRGQTIGLLVADNKFTGSPITDEDIESLITFANTAAIAIHNAQLFHDVKVARERLKASFEASNALISPQEPRRVLQHIVEQARIAADATLVSVLLIDEIGQVQELVTTGTTEKEIDVRQVLRPDGVSMQVMGSGKAKAIEDSHKQRAQVNPTVFEQNVEAALCLPLSLHGKQIGVMWVHYDQPRHLPEFEIEALQLYVNQAAIAYDNARRIEELEHMRQAAEALAGAASPTEVLTQIVQSAREVLGADSTAIWSYDDVRNKFILDSSVAAGIPDALWEEFRQQEPRPGQTAFTVMDRSWIGVNDISDVKRYHYLGEATRTLLGQIEVRSFQGIALTVGEEKLGVLYVNYSRPRNFDEEEQGVAQTFANHAALALKKARLLEQVSKVRNTARVVARVTTLEDLDDTLLSVVKGTRDALGCDAVTLYAYDDDKERVKYPPVMIGVRYPDRALRLPRVAHDSFVLKILEREDVYIVDKIDADDVFMNSRFSKDEKIASCAAVPLKVGRKKVGVMFVNYRTEHRFTSDELINVELFANQAAVAIHGAQLYEQVHARADALQALYEAGRMITRSLDLDHILATTAEQAWKLTGIEGPEARFSNLSLVDGNKLKIVAAYPPERLPEFQRIVGIRDLDQDGHIGVTGRVVRQGRVKLIANVAIDPDYIRYDPETKSELAVPLKIGDQVIGAISVEHPEYSAFDEQDKQALVSLAAQAAIAIQNAQSYREATILQTVSASLVGALELQDVLDLVMGAAMDLTNTESGSILFWDEKLERFSPAFTTMGPQRKLALYSTTARKGGIAWNIMQKREPEIVHDTRSDSRISDVALKKGRRALIGVPLLSGSKFIGVLYVNSSEPRHFSRHQLALLMTLASHTAVAIDKASQYTELKQIYEELKLTKGLVGASTAVAWMGMTSSTWRHAIEGYAITIRDEVSLLRSELNSARLNKKVKSRLKKIERQVQKILERPITPPLSEKEVESISVNDLLHERISQLCENNWYRTVNYDFDLQLNNTATIRASSQWLRQVIDILIDNAVLAMESSSDKQLTISTKQAGIGVEMAFTDTGKGIREEVLPLLFEARITRTKGLGMGLLIASTIVQTYEGRIYVVSARQPTTIAVWLPLES